MDNYAIIFFGTKNNKEGFILRKVLFMFALVSMLVLGLAASTLASTAYLDYFRGDASVEVVPEILSVLHWELTPK